MRGTDICQNNYLSENCRFSNFEKVATFQSPLTGSLKNHRPYKCWVRGVFGCFKGSQSAFGTFCEWVTFYPANQKTSGVATRCQERQKHSPKWTYHGRQKYDQPNLTCFHASLFPFCPLCWPPFFLLLSRHHFALFSPIEKGSVL